MWTTLGCWRQATASASVRKRARSAAPAWQPASTHLRATTRLRVMWRALYTTPMPPRPSSDRISYPGRWTRSAGVGGTAAVVPVVSGVPAPAGAGGGAGRVEAGSGAAYGSWTVGGRSGHGRADGPASVAPGGAGPSG